MDTIQEIVVPQIVPSEEAAADGELDSAGAGASSAETTKSSQDSSFTVTDYNCSSLLLEEDEQPDNDDAGDNVDNNKPTDAIELIDPQGGVVVVEEPDVVKTTVLNGGDGSDSGVEFGGVTGSLNETGILQRALSNNSAGYASSCCGIEESNGVSVSCNSSMISYSSDVYDKTGSTILLGSGRLSNDYCASEGGSESSSVTGGPVSSLRKGGSTTKKKVAMKEPLTSRSPRKSADSGSSSVRSSSRSRASSLGRSVSLNLKTPPTSAMNVAARERARSREKISASNMTNGKTATTPKQIVQTKQRPTKPDSLPTGLKDASPAIQRVNLSRTPSVTRGRTPLGTPTDDGRWPSVGGKGTNASRTTARAGSAAPECVSIKTRVGTLALEAKVSSPLDKFGTLPRRRKEKSAEDLQGSNSRSESLTRDQNRMMTTSLVKKLPSSSCSSKQETPTRTLPNYPKTAGSSKKAVHKTKIYHETSVQTAITCKDVEDAFSGKAKDIKVDAVEKSHKHTQSDIRDREMEKMEEKLKKLSAEYSTLMTKHSEKSQLVTALEQKLLKEREEKLAAQKELQNNSERVLGMLESVQGVPIETGGECDSLLMLESQLQMSGSVLEKKQEEIIKLRKICRTLQTDMERSLKNQEELLRQKTELEEESCELQDFLQAEKASCMEALKESELEVFQLRQSLAQRESEIERQQEDCRHLVRIGEQRRQEFLGMQAKYNALESRSKDILLQQGAAVSGASVALSGLGSRLDHLVEQLIASYNISEQDLEDVIYHNEAYTNSSSGDGSPECELQPGGSKYDDQQQQKTGSLSQKSSKNDPTPLSPQRGQSFIAAVISAIKNATTKSAVLKSNASAAASKEKKEICGHESDSTEMLDSETEPCLMMDNVLEDVAMPDSHSHNMVSSSTRISQIEMPSSLESGANVMISHDESLDNLSQAITNRQQIELQSSIIASGRSPRRFRGQSCSSEQKAGGGTGADHTTASHSSSLEDDENSCCAEASIAEMPSICDYCNAQSLVDQVIDVDNLITKLLKVLRIVQMDNDHCIQELISHKNKLALTNEEIQDRVKEYEEVNIKLKDDLMDASQKLQIRGNEIAKSKVELQSHRQEIDKLNEDICQLSTLCANNQKGSGLTINREDIVSALKLWNENDSIPEKDLINHVVQACNEIPKLKARLCEKEQQLASMTGNMTGTSLVMTASWHQALAEAKRQYEAIDRALETLHSVQSIVAQTPALTQLQRDLEETNFQAIPLVSLPAHLVGGLHQNGNGLAAAGIDLNANQTNNGTIGNGLPVGTVTGNGSAVAGLQLNQPDFIDSTA